MKRLLKLSSFEFMVVGLPVKIWQQTQMDKIAFIDDKSSLP